MNIESLQKENEELRGKIIKLEELAGVRKVIRRRPKYTPAHENAREELRQLVTRHRALVKRKVAIHHMANDRKNHETGEVMKCPVPDDTAMDMNALCNRLDKDAEAIARDMEKCLKLVPIYSRFLKHVYGLGPVTAGYLVAMVDIEKCQKPSQLIRYAGLAVVNGRLERPTKGSKLAYNKELRTRLYQAFSAMMRNAGRDGQTSKYLDIYNDVKHRYASLDRKGGHSAGWHTAMRVLLEDLYIVWRSLEGLDVWVSWYAQQRGFIHGGKRVDAPAEVMDVDEALVMIGHVGSTPKVIAAE